MIKSTMLASSIVALATQSSAQPLEIVVAVVPHVAIEIDQREHYCLNEAIYWEGRNQDWEGKIAIASTIMNRVVSPDFPDSVCGVVHQGPLDGSPATLHRCQFSYYCDGRSDAPPEGNPLELRAWEYADIIAEGVLMGLIEDNTNGSTYYHAHYVDPFWNDSYAFNTTVDDHLFYTHSW